MDQVKFQNPLWTAENEERAFVALKQLKTLWFNTGTRCNMSCKNCYIESTPKNDRLSFLTGEDVQVYIDEIMEKKIPVKEIGLTGGEPFLNPHIVDIVDRCLRAGFKTLVLTNAYRIERYKENIKEWAKEFKQQLVLRVSLDHFSKEIHEQERGVGTFESTLKNVKWLSEQNVTFAIAGRTLNDESDVEQKYASTLNEFGIEINHKDKKDLVIFAEMDPQGDPPEITTACWDILKKSPDDIMCASSRMVVKRKGDEKPKVLACTLIAYDKQFELGETLESSHKNVFLNHAFCAQFCVLGGSSCS